jgi:hypothetical protein
LCAPIDALEAEGAHLDHLLRFSSTEIAFTALEMLDGPQRIFITSDFVHMEVLPKTGTDGSRL